MGDKAKNGIVSYEVLREYGDEHRVFQDIVVSDQECTKEVIERLGRQLAKRFRDKLIVAVNVFTSGRLSSDSKVGENPGEVAKTTGWRLSQYIRSRDAGIHQIMFYPGRGVLAPVVIRYS